MKQIIRESSELYLENIDFNMFIEYFFGCYKLMGIQIWRDLGVISIQVLVRYEGERVIMNNICVFFLGN